MEIFEVHITGDEKIIEAAQKLDVKTIVIDLVKPDRSYFRTEYMTSHTYKCENYDKCKQWVNDVVVKLKEAGVDIVRVKIECPLYPQYRNQSLYFEVHYGAYNNTYPLSKNKGKDHFLCTAREYDRSKYDDLARKHLCFLPTMELCLYDTNVKEDKDWFDLYER